MQRTDFSYDLPPELIAQHPLPERSGSRLLFLDGPTGATSHHSFSDFPDFIGPDDLLVFNNTRVIPARLWGRKATGGKVEILIERFTGSHQALAHIRCSKSPKAGSIIELSPAEGAEPGPYRLTVTGRDDALFQISSEGGVPLPDILREIGHMPLPPYIDRADEAADQERYQTVYAVREGAVAAPTAGLHFTREILQLLDARGVRRVAVTLHVGAGTFQPVRVQNLAEHEMHSEWYHVPQETVDVIAQARRGGARVLAVGTTCLRALETAAAGGELQAGFGDTRLFIMPGYRFRVVERLLTNFHLPKSTLMMLVSAFGGMDNIRSAYRHAVVQRYRFFSYGDAMFIG